MRVRILPARTFEIQTAIYGEPSTLATQFGDRVHYRAQIQFTYSKVEAAYVLPLTAIKSAGIFARR